MHFQEHIWCSKQGMYPSHVTLVSLVYLQKSLFSKFLFLVFLSVFLQFPHLIFRSESAYTKNVCVPHSSVSKESACSAGDLGSLLGLGRSPGEGNGNPVQYSCLENPVDRGAWQVTVLGVAKSQTRLSDFTFTFNRNYPFLPLNLNIVRIDNLILILLLKKIKLEKMGRNGKKKKDG